MAWVNGSPYLLNEIVNFVTSRGSVCKQELCVCITGIDCVFSWDPHSNPENAVHVMCVCVCVCEREREREQRKEVEGCL